MRRDPGQAYTSSPPVPSPSRSPLPGWRSVPVAAVSAPGPSVPVPECPTPAPSRSFPSPGRPPGEEPVPFGAASLAPEDSSRVAPGWAAASSRRSSVSTTRRFSRPASVAAVISRRMAPSRLVASRVTGPRASGLILTVARWVPSGRETARPAACTTGVESCWTVQARTDGAGAADSAEGAGTVAVAAVAGTAAAVIGAAVIGAAGAVVVLWLPAVALAGLDCWDAGVDLVAEAVAVAVTEAVAVAGAVAAAAGSPAARPVAEKGPAVAGVAAVLPVAPAVVCTGPPDTTAGDDGPCPAWAGFRPGLKTVLAGFPAAVMIVAWTAGFAAPGTAGIGCASLASAGASSPSGPSSSSGPAAAGNSADPASSADDSAPATGSDCPAWSACCPTASKETGRVNSRPSRNGVKPSGSTEAGSAPVDASAGAEASRRWSAKLGPREPPPA
ncbi:hypothetical protein ACFFX0_09380 [Citricoccus parietis]|uniref:Uncharacterized protein n=1 Tax=Citricoccus parietis TaxID=592307 RepID=A0ABV5FXH4_9MICC